MAKKDQQERRDSGLSHGSPGSQADRSDGGALPRKIKVSATHVSNVKSRIASGASVGVRGVGRPRKNAADDTNLIPSAVNTVNS